MRTTITICFLAIAMPLLSQNNASDSLQQKLNGNFEVEYPYYIDDSLIILSNYHEQKGNYKKSMVYLKKWISLHNVILFQEKKDRLNELQIKYEVEKNQLIRFHKNELSENEALFQLSAFSVFIIFAYLILTIILYRKKEQAFQKLVYQNFHPPQINLKKKAGGLAIENENSLPDTEKYEHPRLDEEHKKQIIESLHQFIENKAYTETGLILKKLAEDIGTNRSYLSIVINENYHQSFPTFINRLRIEESIRILSDSNNNIPFKELYHLLGFHSYSTFNEAFRKYTGETPAIYKNKLKETKNPPINPVD